MAQVSLLQKLAVTACAYTRTTNLVARWTGATPFLPRLFVLRYANMGGLDQGEFAQQIRAATSFHDDNWCAYWDSIAAHHAQRADDHLRQLEPQVPGLTSSPLDVTDDVVTRLAEAVNPGATLLADQGPQPSRCAVDALVKAHIPPADRERAATSFSALDAWVKAMTYYQISAFPGHSPRRLQAYWRSQELFAVLARVMAAALDLTIEQVDIPAGAETVRGWLVLPPGSGPHPVVLTTNGLEGTVQELAIGQLRYRASGLALFMMEMPGSFSYREPMRPESETIFRDVIGHLAADRRLDSRRIGMVGVSFGGYWSARMAANDDRLACAVACGAPTHHTFNGGSLGLPEVIISAMADTVGATNPVRLIRSLRSLSIRDRYANIDIPLLAINGDDDTLLSTQDTIDLAEGAPQGQLLLYADDDHCAMGHYRQWLDYVQEWLADQLSATPT